LRGEGRRPPGRARAERSVVVLPNEKLVITRPPMRRFHQRAGSRLFTHFRAAAAFQQLCRGAPRNADDSGRDFAKLQSVLLSTNHGSVSPRIPADFFFPGPRRAFARVETRRTRGRVARHTPPERGRERTKTARATLAARSIEREFAGARSRDPARRREAPRRLARCVARSGERKEQPSSSHLVSRARTSVALVRARATPRPSRADASRPRARTSPRLAGPSREFRPRCTPAARSRLRRAPRPPRARPAPRSARAAPAPRRDADASPRPLTARASRRDVT